MFGCVIDVGGFSQDFVQQGDGSYAIDVPGLDRVEHVSVFLLSAECFAQRDVCAVAHFLVDGVDTPVGSLTEFSPSFTFFVPRTLQGAGPGAAGCVGRVGRLLLTLQPLGHAIAPVQHLPTPEEDYLLNVAANKMMAHFYASLGGAVVHDDGRQFIPLEAVQRWKERLQREMAQVSNFWGN